MTQFVPEIIPALLVHSHAEAITAWDMIQEAEWAQIDCLDGQFVPNKSFCEAQAWPTTGPRIELHLMCHQPLEVMRSWAKHPLFGRAIWHFEAPVDHQALITWCKAHNVECGLALNPETALTALDGLVQDLDCLLLLSVHPGWNGQAFLQTTIAKAHEAHERYPDLLLGIDGGLTNELISSLAHEGVRRFYIGSHIFSAKQDAPEAALHKLINLTHHLPL